MAKENPRVKSAREHDDKDIIEQMEDAPDFVGAKGGNVQRDMGSKLEVDELLHGDPDAPVRPSRAPRAP
jgi:hypothetical protein